MRSPARSTSSLWIPVVATHEAQLALARGAAAVGRQAGRTSIAAGGRAGARFAGKDARGGGGGHGRLVVHAVLRRQPDHCWRRRTFAQPATAACSPTRDSVPQRYRAGGSDDGSATAGRKRPDRFSTRLHPSRSAGTSSRRAKCG